MAVSIVQFNGGPIPTSDGGALSTTNTQSLLQAPVIGNLLIASFGVSNHGGTITPPAGWTEMTGVDVPSPVLSSTQVWIGYRYVTSADVSNHTYTFTFSSASVSSLLIRELAGTAASNPIDTGGMSASAINTTYIVNSIAGTVSSTGGMLCLEAFANGGASAGFNCAIPAGFTQDTKTGSSDTGATHPIAYNLAHQTNSVSSTSIPSYSVTFSGTNFSGNVESSIYPYVVKAAATVTVPLNVSDVGAQVSDAASIAQLQTGTTPDVGAQVSEKVSVTKLTPSLVPIGLRDTEQYYNPRRNSEGWGFFSGAIVVGPSPAPNVPAFFTDPLRRYHSEGWSAVSGVSIVGPSPTTLTVPPPLETTAKGRYHSDGWSAVSGVSIASVPPRPIAFPLETSTAARYHAGGWYVASGVSVKGPTPQALGLFLDTSKAARHHSEGWAFFIRPELLPTVRPSDTGAQVKDFPSVAVTRTATSGSGVSGVRSFRHGNWL